MPLTEVRNRFIDKIRPPGIAFAEALWPNLAAPRGSAREHFLKKAGRAEWTPGEKQRSDNRTWKYLPTGSDGASMFLSGSLRNLYRQLRTTRSQFSTRHQSVLQPALRRFAAGFSYPSAPYHTDSLNSRQKRPEALTTAPPRVKISPGT